MIDHEFMDTEFHISVGEIIGETVSTLNELSNSGGIELEVSEVVRRVCSKDKFIKDNIPYALLFAIVRLATERLLDLSNEVDDLLEQVVNNTDMELEKTDKLIVTKERTH